MLSWVNLLPCSFLGRENRESGRKAILVRAGRVVFSQINSFRGDGSGRGSSIVGSLQGGVPPVKTSSLVVFGA